MRRSVALLLLAVFMVPYARAPLCQLESHDHEMEGEVAKLEGAGRMASEHAQVPHAHDAHDPASLGEHAVFTGTDGDPDCHQQMMCDAAVDQVVASPADMAERPVPLLRPRMLRATDVALVALSIDLPPPRRA